MNTTTTTNTTTTITNVTITTTTTKKKVRRLRYEEQMNAAHLEIQEYWAGTRPLGHIVSQVEMDHRALCRWMLNRLDVMDELGLSKGAGSGLVQYRDFRYCEVDWQGEVVGPARTIIFPRSLEAIGVYTPGEAKRFLAFYKQVHNPTRGWTSGCQVDQSRVADIALTPNYNRLPEWVRRGLLLAPESACIGGERVGDIWRLPACVKAWKWCPDLPKNLAEKVGNLSIRMRVLASFAWCKSTGGRAERQEHFWSNLAELSQMTIEELIKFLSLFGSSYWDKKKWRGFVSAVLNLPFELIEYGVEDTVTLVLEKYSNLERLSDDLFGISGKGTVRALRSCQNGDLLRWAKELAYANPDAVQKILGLQSCVPYQEDAVPFLMSLPLQTRIRMLGTTTFKYRGEVHTVSGDYVRDAGYLWSSIQEKPDLGRVRCWFGVHAQLSAAYVEQIPEGPVPVPAGWEHLDGLCSIHNSWELVFPKSQGELKYYGQVLDNCVGGYGEAIKCGRSVIIIVREAGLPSHCIEICDGRFQQFYGRKNGPPDRVIHAEVTAVLRQAAVVK